ncbi:hypothetical protein O3S68_21965 [Kosakonia sp. SOY2]|uniref:hypothetical protein n=1 Tax=Kosakonia sp. SOY2 TaxID=3014557 RepID=UPI0022AC0643|nr:hypothetical protein [Kosakonia sp. SOY2]MCZ3384948.1 hypothetical protein [Kosakonia sp. SOY2]
MKGNELIMQGTLKDIFVLSQQHHIAGWHFRGFKLATRQSWTGFICPGLMGLASPEIPGAAGEIHHESVAISE